jgi:predicted Fe-S protein YdhL (DUF1289 family)
MSSIPSPCRKVCRLQNGICLGCERTVQEITNWSTMTDQQKQDCWTRLRGFPEIGSGIVQDTDDNGK